MKYGQHSKGPWKAMPENRTGLYNVTRNIGVGTNETVISTDEALANAKLIASAPEMLEVLKQVQLLISGSRFHDEKERLKVWSKVDDVVNKAKGAV